MAFLFPEGARRELRTSPRFGHAACAIPCPCAWMGWRDQLPQRFPDETWRDKMIAEAQQWSQRVLDTSGLLVEG